MASGPRRRILLAIEPVVLESALATLLGQLGGDEVISFHGPGPGQEPPPTQTYDAVVVGMPLDPVTSAVVIRLPDDKGNAGIGTVSVDGQTRPVHIGTHVEIIDLLDRYCPAPSARQPSPRPDEDARSSTSRSAVDPWRRRGW